MKQVDLKKYEIQFRGMSRPKALSVNSGNPEIHWIYEKSYFLLEWCSENWKLKIKTLKKEIKAVLWEKT